MVTAWTFLAPVLHVPAPGTAEFSVSSGTSKPQEAWRAVRLGPAYGFVEHADHLFLVRIAGQQVAPLAAVSRTHYTSCLREVSSHFDGQHTNLTAAAGWPAPLLTFALHSAVPPCPANLACPTILAGHTLAEGPIPGAEARPCPMVQAIQHQAPTD